MSVRSLKLVDSVAIYLGTTAEAPLYFYATKADSASIRTVADQCAETGFEAIILSFGSGKRTETVLPSTVWLSFVICRFQSFIDKHVLHCTDNQRR